MSLLDLDVLFYMPALGSALFLGPSISASLSLQVQSMSIHLALSLAASSIHVIKVCKDEDVGNAESQSSVAPT